MAWPVTSSGLWLSYRMLLVISTLRGEVRRPDWCCPYGASAWMRDRLDELFAGADFAEVRSAGVRLTDAKGSRLPGWRSTWTGSTAWAWSGRPLVTRRGRIRTHSMHVLAMVRRLNRGELVAEIVCLTLERAVSPWREVAEPGIPREWADRCDRPVRYDPVSGGGEALPAYVLQVCEGKVHVLQAIHGDDAPPHLRELPTAQVRRQVWVQRFWHGEGPADGWRDPASVRFPVKGCVSSSLQCSGRRCGAHWVRTRRWGPARVNRP